MKRMSTEQRKKVSRVLAIFLVVALVLACCLPFLVRADDSVNESISIEASIGFDGNVKILRFAPVEITVTNNTGKDFKGRVRVNVPASGNSYDGNSSCYYSEIELAEGGSKNIRFDFPVITAKNEYRIEVLNNKDKLVSSRSLPVYVHRESEVWAGYLADSNDDLKYLSPGNYQDEGQIYDFTADNFPESVEALSSFGVVYINKFNTRSLSEKSIEALNGWVEDGGYLVIGENKNSTITSSGLASAFGLDDKSSFKDSELSMTLKNSYLPYNQSYNPSIKSVGNGYIIWHHSGFGLNDELYFDYNFRNEVTYLYSMADDNNYSFGTSKLDRISSVGYETQNIPNETSFFEYLISIVILLYIIFLWPVLYLVLKKLDKKEKALKIIPISALIVSAVIFVLSSGTSNRTPIANSITLIDASNSNSVDSSVATVVNILTPKRGDITYEFEDNINYAFVSEYSYISSRGFENWEEENENISDEIRIDKPVVVKSSDNSSWQEKFFFLESEFSLNGGIDIDITKDTYGSYLEGTITNNSGFDLTDVIFAYSEDVYYLGEFKNGAVLDVTDQAIFGESKKKKNVYDVFRVLDSSDKVSTQVKRGITDELVSSRTVDEIRISGFIDKDIIGDVKVDNKKARKFNYTAVYAESEVKYGQTGTDLYGLLGSMGPSEISAGNPKYYYSQRDADVSEMTLCDSFTFDVPLVAASGNSFYGVVEFDEVIKAYDNCYIEYDKTQMVEFQILNQNTGWWEAVNTGAIKSFSDIYSFLDIKQDSSGIQYSLKYRAVPITDQVSAPMFYFFSDN